MKLFKSRLWLIGLILILVTVYMTTDVGSYLTIENLKANQNALSALFENQPLLVTVGFILAYVVITAFSIPGATIMTLTSGAIFGLWYGTIIALFASSVGATFAFLGARFLFRESLEVKFKDRLAQINHGIEKEGAFYLFTLRLLPLVPFFLINLLMGLTSIRVGLFFIVSMIGMLPGAFVYVNAGTQLAQIETLGDILSPKLILSFVLLGLVPLALKWALNYFKARQLYAKYKKPKSFDYNMVVIGGGSAGLVSAFIASAVNAKVALIEKHKMGGDCLNTGCVPSKALIRSAKILNYFNRAEEFGLYRPDVTFDFAKVMERVQNVIKKIAPNDSVARYTELGVDCITSEAQILSPYQVQVDGRVLTTKTIVIATGAKPFVPPILGLDQIQFLTSDNIWNLRTLPKRLLVLGGGTIGCEIAQCFARFGSNVTLIERSKQILAREDADTVKVVRDAFEKNGVNIRTSHNALRFETSGADKYLVCESNGQEEKIHFDEVLLALGRRANVKGFGLENLDIEISKHGSVVADEYLRTTNYPNIYVCGDVAGPYQLTNAASHQAWYVAVNALFSPFKKFKVPYKVIPSCTFTDPEVARVGLSEVEAKEKSVAYEISKYDIADLDRAITEGEARGFVKVLTAPGSDKILGVTIVGSHAGDIIAEYVTAMKFGLGLNKIMGTIHIYPTLAEANKYAAGVWKKAHAPKTILHYLRKFHSWRRS